LLALTFEAEGLCEISKLIGIEAPTAGPIYLSERTSNLMPLILNIAKP
jgi:hypothetical protein